MDSEPAKKPRRGVWINSARLKELGEKKGWSQDLVARRLGISKRGYEVLLQRGRTSTFSAAALAKLFGVELENILAPPPVQRHARLDQLPEPVADFVGRGTVSRLFAQRLSRSSISSGPTVILGMGGLGKTSLAVRVAHAAADAFPDARLFVDLRGMSDRPLTAAEVLTRVIRAFHPEARLPDTAADLAAVYRSAVAGKRVLIVLDNAKDEGQVEHLVTSPAPVGIVITSRTRLDLDGVEHVSLDLLTEGESLALLRGVLKTKGTDMELASVAALCGHLPLALRVAGMYLRHDNWPLSTYIRALTDEQDRLRRLKGNTPGRDVEAVIALSARQVVREDERLAGLWQMLAVFPADFNEFAVAAVWDCDADGVLDELSAVDELTRLLDRSLVQYDPARGWYTLHDLLRPVARNVFDYADGDPVVVPSPGALHDAQRRMADHYRSVLAEIGRLYRAGGRDMLDALSIYDQEDANIRAGWTWAAAARESDSFAAELCRDYGLCCPHLLHLRLSFRALVAWLQTAVEACQTLGDTSHEGELVSDLGCVHLDLGDTQAAVNCFRRALTLARTSRDDGLVGVSLGNLGTAYALLGKGGQAALYLERAVGLLRGGGRQREEVSVLVQLGNVHLHHGEIRTAFGCYESAYKIASEVGDLRTVAIAVGSLGNLTVELGDARSAIQLIGEQLRLTRRLADRPGELMALANLGNASSLLGENSSALGYYDQARGIAAELGDRRAEAKCCLNAGGAHAELGDHGSAVRMYQQALTASRDVGDRPTQGLAGFQLALSLEELGHRSDAIRAAESALAVLEVAGDPTARNVRDQLAAWLC